MHADFHRVADRSGQARVYHPAFAAPNGRRLAGDLFRQFDSQIEDGPDCENQVGLELGPFLGDVDRRGIPTRARRAPEEETQRNSQAVTATATTLDDILWIAQPRYSIGLSGVAGHETS